MDSRRRNRAAVSYRESDDDDDEEAVTEEQYSADEDESDDDIGFLEDSKPPARKKARAVFIGSSVASSSLKKFLQQQSAVARSPAPDTVASMQGQQPAVATIQEPQPTVARSAPDTDANASNQASNPDPVRSTGPDSVPSQQRPKIPVDFLFSSYKTQVFNDGGLKGRLRVEHMEQDPATGMYSIPVGRTPFQIELDSPVKPANSWCLSSSTPPATEFSGTFSRAVANGPISMRTGLVLDYASGNPRGFKATVRPKKWPLEYPHYRNTKVCGSESLRARAENLAKWEHEQGGFLELYAAVSERWNNEVPWGRWGGSFTETRGAKGKYKIKLYTVLSAFKPGQDHSSLPTYTDGMSPDWNALVGIVAARNPNLARSWAERAVRQYSYFLDLKFDATLKKQKCSPSYMIDEIWHAHLSFQDQYQRDMACLSQGRGIFLEHLPVHLKQSVKSYEKAYNEHSKRMRKIGEDVDAEFWPAPQPYDPKQHEHASDTKKVEGELYVGKPCGGGGSGCGGCG